MQCKPRRCHIVWPCNSGPAPVLPSTLCLCDHFLSQFWSARIKLLLSEYSSESVVRVNRKVDQIDGQVLPTGLQLTCWFSLAERSRRGSRACSISVLLSHVCAVGPTDWSYLSVGPVPPPSLLQCACIHVKDNSLVSWATEAGQTWDAVRMAGCLTCTSPSWADQLQGCSEGPRTALIAWFALPNIPFFTSHTKSAQAH